MRVDSPYTVSSSAIRSPCMPLSFFSCYRSHPNLHSFPTRRSSDLRPPRAGRSPTRGVPPRRPGTPPGRRRGGAGQDRKSTRLNSSHVAISYAVFCLKKKIEDTHNTTKNERLEIAENNEQISDGSGV